MARSALRGWVLGAGAFVVTADGTLVVGLLGPISRSLSVSASVAGQAVTIFALGYAAGSPLVVRVLRRLGPRSVLVLVLSGFVAAQLLTAAANSSRGLLLARLAAGICAGTFMPVASATMAANVEPASRGRALAVIVAGASAGTAVGVPAGTWIGSQISWRLSFTLMAVVALGLTGALLVLVPATPAAGLPRRRSGAPVAASLAVTVLWSTGSFTFFTYLTVVLHAASGIEPSAIAALLLLFGVAGVAGAMVSGRVVDHGRAYPARSAALLLLAASLTGLGLAAQLGGSAGKTLSIVALCSYGFATWAVTPAQQAGLLVKDGDERLILSLNASCLYTGVALGAALGGVLLARSHSPAVLCFSAAGIELAALTVALIDRPGPALSR